MPSTDATTTSDEEEEQPDEITHTRFLGAI
jgi:hypothetical protein